MTRFSLPASALLFLLAPTGAYADAFDNYTNPMLAKVPAWKLATQVKQLTTEMMVEHNRALPGTTAAFIVVRTNDGRLAKLLVRPAAQKLSEGDTVPILFIERLVTFKEGEE